MNFHALWNCALLALSLPLPAAVTLYPAGGGSNLRVPVIAPAPGGAKGKAVDFEGVRFTYELLPHFRAAETGELEFFVRDLPRRLEKAVLVLTGADGGKLELLVNPASTGRTFTLRGGKAKAVSAERPQIAKWRKYRLELLPGKAVFHAGGETVCVPLPPGFRPVRLAVYAAMVDELSYRSGGAELKLDWEQDYTARVEPAKHSGGVSAALHGFDSFAVSTDPAKRDCPTLQLANSTDAERAVTLEYSVKSELGKLDRSWKQQFRLAPGEEVIEAVKFPFPLTSDLYHLTLKTTGTDNGDRFRRHFLYAEPRGEKPGPGLFGLHDCDVNTFGFWPDALPLRYSHKYLRWGYVVGPAWLKDFDGGYGLDPDTPPAEWNWNEKLDWELASGREMYVCLQSTPLSDWQRERPYKKMRKLAWGWSGGFPKLDRYAEFVRAAGERYKGRIRLWEVENEPNASSHMPDKPGDYAQICRTVAAALKPLDRANVIFGISGTSTFVPWMGKVLAAGGCPALDAISWHTYTTPEQPDKAGLPDMLREARKVASKYNRFFNSETGILTAFRYRADEPIPPETVAEKVAARAAGFVSKNAWPGRVNDEYQSSMSIVKNAAINFLAGTEAFIFFGWNPKWPAEPAKWQQNTPSFSLISATADGERTPSLATLAVGVLAMQFEGVVLNPAPVPAGSGGVNGGIFRKADGGEVALLWSQGPTGSVLLASPAPELELVSLYGEKSALKPVSSARGVNTFLLPLTDRPLYVHADRAGMRLEASPVDAVKVRELPDGKAAVTFTLLNRSDKAWNARIKAPSDRQFHITPAAASIEIAPKKRRNLTFQLEPAQQPQQPEFHLPFAVELPGGGDFRYSVKLANRPAVKIGRTPSQPLMLNRVEQAVVGRPPKLASLQEDYFWGGPDELSGEARLAYDDNALYLTVKVHDANLKAPEPWPGVAGSSLELFLDLRTPEQGLGGAHYGDGVCQFLIRPELPGVKAAIWSPQLPDAVRSGVAVTGKTQKDGYEVTVTLPWRAFGLRRVPESFGFDLGLNGAFPDQAKRKTQLMLFGTAQNFRSAAGFGRIHTQEK